MSRYDVITFGETMLRLTPPHFLRLRQAHQLEIEVGGSESNTAVGLAMLGLKAAWLSCLPRNPLGELAAGTLAGYGVDTSHLVWSDSGRMGLYFYERGKLPRGSRVIYDRKDSAISRMRPGDLPEALFQAENARMLHLTGITPALSRSAAATSLRAVELAQAAGWRVSFDLNYRARLWDIAAALQGCEPFMQRADILILPLRDSISFFGMDPQTSPESACRAVAAAYPGTTVVMTLGSDGAVGCDVDGNLTRQAAFPAEEVGRLGAGDACTAGLLYGLLEKDSLADALRWGTAAAAVKYTVPGDIPVMEKEEVERLVGASPEAPRLSR